MIVPMLQIGMISVLTQIGLDHIDILGDTIEEIARVKSGIIKQNQDTVMCVQNLQVVDIVKQVCRDKNNVLHLIDSYDIKNCRVQGEFQRFDYGEYKDIDLNLKGDCQFFNASEVLCTIDILREKGYYISEDAIRKRT